MTTQLEPVTVYLEPEVKEGLAIWAKQERRSFSSLAAYLLAKAYQEHQKEEST